MTTVPAIWFIALVGIVLTMTARMTDDGASATFGANGIMSRGFVVYIKEVKWNVDVLFLYALR